MKGATYISQAINNTLVGDCVDRYPTRRLALLISHLLLVIKLKVKNILLVTLVPHT